MQNKWTTGPSRDASKLTAKRLSQDELRFRRQEAIKKLAQKKEMEKRTATK